jgi:hemerythrin
MAYFEWNSQVELDHPLINAQHKRLFVLSEAVAQSAAGAADQRPTEPALRDLIAFAREHFAAEEGLMRASNYAPAATHAHYHALLLGELEEYFRKVQKDGDRDGNTRLTVTGLVAFLWRWLILHIDSADRELVRWLKEQPTTR